MRLFKKKNTPSKIDLACEGFDKMDVRNREKLIAIIALMVRYAKEWLVNLSEEEKQGVFDGMKHMVSHVTAKIPGLLANPSGARAMFDALLKEVKDKSKTFNAIYECVEKELENADTNH